MSTARRLATIDDLLALDPDIAAELIDGEIVEKASPSYEHGDAQGAVSGGLRDRFHRRGKGDAPGGWWIATEVDVHLGGDVVRPDIVGWRRDRVPVAPRGRPVKVRPDWVCEVLSPSTARHDVVDKPRILHRAGVPHYWIVDLEREVFTVFRREEAGWLVVLQAGPEDRVRAEPFDAVELDCGPFFGRDPDEPGP